MTIQDGIDFIGSYRAVIALYFLLLPLLGWALGFLPYNRHGRVVVWDYGYSALVYLVGIPGMISAVLIGYSLFFVRQNLLEVNFLIYFLPVVSMGVSYYFIGRKVSFDRLPGFDRLIGLMILIGLSFLIVLVLFKLRLFVGFFASIETLALIGVAVFLLFQYASVKLFK